MVIKLSFISPTKHLKDIAMQGDYLYILAHIEHEHYIDFHRKARKYKIIDNAVHECLTLKASDYIQRAILVKANELIIPDAMKYAKETVRLKNTFLSNYGNNVKDMKLQAVIQGRFINDIISCYKTYVRDRRIDVIGIPFDLTPFNLAREKYENQMENRIAIIERISKLKQHKPTHLLGLNHPIEIFLLSKYKFIRSNDSKLCCRCALSNISFYKYVTKPGRKMEFSDILNKKQLQIANYNINYLKKFAR